MIVILKQRPCADGHAVIIAYLARVSWFRDTIIGSKINRAVPKRTTESYMGYHVILTGMMVFFKQR
jgi:hypothetical protein